MLIATGVLLAAVLVVMVGSTVRTMQGAGWVPIHSLDVQLPYWLGTWLGVFPTWETLGAQVAALAFVIGSYFAAEYVRVTRPRRRAALRREPLRAPGPVGLAQEVVAVVEPVRAALPELDRLGHQPVAAPVLRARHVVAGYRSPAAANAASSTERSGIDGALPRRPRPEPRLPPPREAKYASDSSSVSRSTAPSARTAMHRRPVQRHRRARIRVQLTALARRRSS